MTRIDIGASPRPEPEMTSESGGSSDTEEEVGGGGGRHHTAESHHEDKKVGAFSEYCVPQNFAETFIPCLPAAGDDPGLAGRLRHERQPLHPQRPERPGLHPQQVQRQQGGAPQHED